MLKIAQKTDHALMIAVGLAERAGGLPLSLEELSRNTGVSQGYLEEVAGLLRSAGIITGKRGAHGGYVLSRPAAEISLANVITAVEGAAWSGECLGERAPGKRTNSAVWRKVQGRVMAELHRTTLADILAEKV